MTEKQKIIRETVLSGILVVAMTGALIFLGSLL